MRLPLCYTDACQSSISFQVDWCVSCRTLHSWPAARLIPQRLGEACLAYDEAIRSQLAAEILLLHCRQGIISASL